MRYSQAGHSGKQTCLCAYCHFITSYLSVPSTTMHDDEASSSGAIAFALIYLTFFLDNVLLTVLGLFYHLSQVLSTKALLRRALLHVWCSCSSDNPGLGARRVAGAVDEAGRAAGQHAEPHGAAHRR